MRILGFSGRKQAGKDSACRFLIGHTLITTKMNDQPIWDFYRMTEDGQLMIPCTDETGHTEEMIFDPDLIDSQEKVEYLHNYVWPHVKRFSLADPIKRCAMDYFGLSYEQCYGTNEEKNSPTQYKWRDFPKFSYSVLPLDLPADASFWDEYLTAREFLQEFGTNIGRRLHQNIWADHLLRDISNYPTETAIIPDVRFPNEVECIQKAGGKIVRLTRTPHEDVHISETALDKENYDWSKFDSVIDNADLTLEETNEKILAQVKEWGWA